MSRMIGLLVTAILLAGAAIGQSPNVSQVLMYSATTTNLKVNVLNSSGTAVIGSYNLPRAIPSIYSQNAISADISDPRFVAIILNGANFRDTGNFTVSQNIVQLNNALNASIASALSIIPLSSPASGVIVKKDPVTGAELPVSGTLGPLFTERAETIGKRKLYFGISNQNYHFTKFNGTSLNALSVLYKGGDPSKLTASGRPLATVPATFGVAMDVRLSQNIAFITYGVTEKLDVSLGLPMTHSAVSARTYNGIIYGGNGFLSNGSSCWCVGTFTPGFPTLTQPDINQTSLAKSGLGDVLVRVKGTVLRKSNVVVALGGGFAFAHWRCRQLPWRRHDNR